MNSLSKDSSFLFGGAELECIFSKRKWRYSQWAILIILKEAEESVSELKAIFVSRSSWAGAAVLCYHNSPPHLL